ncbi:MAG: hypothetical protein R2733_10700 [Acidimicrobiales bacterium]
MPADEWEAIKSDVLAVVAAGRPDSRKIEQAWLSDVAGLARWAYRRGQPRTVESLLLPWVIEAYVADPGNGWSGGTARTIRSRLTQLARRALGDDAVPGYEVPLAPPDPRAPFSDAEIAAVVAWARFMNTPAQRHSLLAAMACCAGAGLNANELASLRGEHVVEVDGHAHIVVEGARQREIPVTDEWHEIALHAASSVGRDRFVFRPERRTVSRNTTNDFFHKMRAKAHGQVPLLSCQRLRATWIVGRLKAGCPVVAVADGAGIQRGGLARYLVFLPDIDAEQRNRLLRGTVE